MARMLDCHCWNGDKRGPALVTVKLQALENKARLGIPDSQVQPDDLRTDAWHEICVRSWVNVFACQVSVPYVISSKERPKLYKHLELSHLFTLSVSGEARHPSSSDSKIFHRLPWKRCRKFVRFVFITRHACLHVGMRLERYQALSKKTPSLTRPDMIGGAIVEKVRYVQDDVSTLFPDCCLITS
jgi:hypothetical protein